MSASKRWMLDDLAVADLADAIWSSISSGTHDGVDTPEKAIAEWLIETGHGEEFYAWIRAARARLGSRIE